MTTQAGFGTVGTVGTQANYLQPSRISRGPSIGSSVPSVPSVPCEAQELLRECDQAGLELWVDAGKLRYRGPAGALTQAMVRRLQTHKPEMLRILSLVPDQASPPLKADAYSFVLPVDFPISHIGRFNRLLAIGLAEGIDRAECCRLAHQAVLNEIHCDDYHARGDFA